MQACSRVHNITTSLQFTLETVTISRIVARMQYSWYIAVMRYMRRMMKFRLDLQQRIMRIVFELPEDANVGQD